MMQLDKEGAMKWSTATEKSTSKQLAFVLNDELLQVATVNGRIEGGAAALNPGIYTRQELDSFIKIIKQERKR